MKLGVVSVQVSPPSFETATTRFPPSPPPTMTQWVAEGQLIPFTLRPVWKAAGMSLYPLQVVRLLVTRVPQVLPNCASATHDVVAGAQASTEALPVSIVQPAGREALVHEPVALAGGDPIATIESAMTVTAANVKRALEINCRTRK